MVQNIEQFKEFSIRSDDEVISLFPETDRAGAAGMLSSLRVALGASWPEQVLRSLSLWLNDANSMLKLSGPFQSIYAKCIDSEIYICDPWNTESSMNLILTYHNDQLIIVDPHGKTWTSNPERYILYHVFLV